MLNTGYGEPKGEGMLPYKRIMGMCCWMGSHFLNWIDYNGVALLIENGVAHFRIFGVRKLFTFTVSKHTRMFVKCSSLNLKKKMGQFILG